MTKSKIISGTKEWAKENVNCVTGCSNNCRYCYARAMGTRVGIVGRQHCPSGSQESGVAGNIIGCEQTTLRGDHSQNTAEVSFFVR